MSKHVQGKHRMETITDALSRREIKYGVRGGPRYGFFRCPWLTDSPPGEPRQFALFGSRLIK